MKHFYAESDSFTGDYPNEFTSGFANTKVAVVFDSFKEREDWLKETKLLTAKRLTRKEAMKLAERIPWEGRVIRYCASGPNLGYWETYLVVKEA